MTTHSDRRRAGSNTTVPRGAVLGNARPPTSVQRRRALESDRRRAVLRRLLEADEDERIPVRTLAGVLADAEDDPTVVTTLLELRQRIYVSLCRTHLPLLESCGLVAYDRERGIVSRGRDLPAIESDLEGDPVDGTARVEPA